MSLIYLDACCLNRPFDDQSQGRIRLEAEAVLFVLGQMEERGWVWVGSEVLRFELGRTPDPERRHRTALMMGKVKLWVPFGEAALRRARQLGEAGLQSFDALHLACAESGGVDVLLTTDDRFAKQAGRISSNLRCRVINPLAWCKEVLDHGEERG